MNVKKLLCYTIVNGYECSYNDNCMYAHHIDEQTKEPLRQYIYDMITTMEDLSEINLYENTKLFNELKIYTKECRNCILSKCAGGYNCKYGVCFKKLKICYDNLVYGKCMNIVNNMRCINGIHLTEKNLIPYNLRELGDDSIYENDAIKIITFNLGTNIEGFNKFLSPMRIRLGKQNN